MAKYVLDANGSREPVVIRRDGKQLFSGTYRECKEFVAARFVLGDTLEEWFYGELTMTHASKEVLESAVAHYRREKERA